MDYPICIYCNRPILFSGDVSTTDGRLACTCICKAWNVNITTSNNTIASPMSVSDWSKHLKAVREWHTTLYGRIDGVREPVPDAFQDAFKDGDLEL